jgi:lipoprotein NlpI
MAGLRCVLASDGSMIPGPAASFQPLPAATGFHIPARRELGHGTLGISYETEVLMRFLIAACAVAGLVLPAARAQTVDELLDRALAALKDNRPKDALVLAGKAVAKDARGTRALTFRAELHTRLANHADAARDYDRVIALDPKAADAYQRRGEAHFKLGKINESIADWDRYIALRPDKKAGHWQRGISYYYAGRFKDGRDQFAAYEEVDTNDVENSVWHYLCNARLVGPEKARAQMLKIGRDKRVPLMVVFDLFLEKAKPADVLKAANAGKPEPELLKRQLFYAHLYLGLYHESKGDRKKTLEHMAKAANDYNVGGYMWEVARVHLDLRRAEAKKK